MDFLGEVPRVYEDECLRRLARLKHILYEIEFLALLALELVLLDMIELQFLGFDHNLLRFSNNLTLPFMEELESLLILRLEGGREQHPLELPVLQRFVARNLFE